MIWQVRLRTGAQKDAAEARAQARYERLYEEVEAADRTEWETEFGAGNPAFPFCPNVMTIHARVEQKMKNDRDDD